MIVLGNLSEYYNPDPYECGERFFYFDYNWTICICICTILRILFFSPLDIICYFSYIVHSLIAIGVRLYTLHSLQSLSIYAYIHTM